MKMLRVMAAFGLLIAVVALAPFSSWEFRSVVDTWRGHDSSLLFQAAQIGGADPTAVSKDPLMQIDGLFVAGRTKFTDHEFAKKMVAQYGSSAPAMGALGRAACITLPERIAGSMKVDAETSLLVGEHLAMADRENAFGPVLIAMARYGQGDEAASWAALQSAGARSEFKTYAFDEARARVVKFEMANGYRGEWARLAQYAGITFPHLASVREYANSACREGSIRERLAIAKLGLTMVRSDDAVITNMVGDGLIQAACLPPGSQRPKDKAEKAANLAWFREQVNKAGLSAPDQFWEALGRLASARFDLSPLINWDESEVSATKFAALGLPFLIAGFLLCLLSLAKAPPVRASANFPTLQKLGAFFVMPLLLLGTPTLFSLAAHFGRRWELNWLEIGVILAFCLIASRSRLRVREWSAVSLLAVGSVMLVGGMGSAIQKDASASRMIRSLAGESELVKRASGLTNL